MNFKHEIFRIENLFPSSVISDFHVVAYKHDPGPYIAMFQDIFNKTLSMEHEDKHHGMMIMEAISENDSQVINIHSKALSLMIAFSLYRI